ncbi:MAG: prepilin-type N-terminal cleavage/methylation domain-containing protein, partial [Bacilli bacterium]|nr:prepilin-type N-terminal cleavage/methylation domain-containing protein [Bacilli bacterium]
LMVKHMNKRGVTLLEVLISIALISVVILMLVKLMFSLEKINNDTSYASQDEIERAEIIKTIEKDFLDLKLNGIKIEEKTSETVITFNYVSTNKTLKVKANELVYEGQKYTLKSDKATYSECPSYKYLTLDNDYYYVELKIPVLISGDNTTENDDIILSYLGLLNDSSLYLPSYTCVK